MGIIDWLETRASLEDPNTPIAQGVTLMDLFGGQATWTGRRVNDATALTSSAVYAAVNIISGTVGALPLKVYRRLDRGKEEAREHPLWPILHDAPNADMTAVNYRESCQGHLLLRGNTYSAIEADRSGRVTGLYPYHPSNVTPIRLDNGDRAYRVTYPDGTQEIIAAERMLHIAGLGGGDGIGYGVITLARQSIALGLGQEEYAARFFGNSSRPQGILSAPEELSVTARENVRDSWTQAYGGLDNTHKVAVLDSGLTWQSVGMSNEDSQFLESRNFSVREVARWFNIPPHKIRDLEDATFSNIEAQNVEFATDTLMPWLVRWQQGITQQLLSPGDRDAGYFVEFVVSGLLRGDSAARSEYYRTLFALGAITPNEIRSKENFDLPVDGGDVPFIQLNMIPLDQADTVLTQPQDDGGVPADAPEGDDEPDEDEGESDARIADGGHESRASRSPTRRLALRVTFLPLLEEAARRLVRREVAHLRRMIDRYITSGNTIVFLRALEDFYREDFPVEIKQVMGPVLRALADQSNAAARQEVDDLPGDGAVGEEWTDAYIDTFANRYSADSRRQIRDIARTPVEDEGPSVVDLLEDRLERWDEGDQGAPRSAMVARRESTQLINAMTKVTFAAAGVLTLVWVTTGDNCPMCDAMEGRVVSIDIPFVAPGERVGTDETNITPTGSIGHPPLHDGCDCMIVPG